MFAASPRPSRALRRALSALALLVVLALGIFLGGHPGWMPSGLRDAFEQRTPATFMQSVLDEVSNDYYRPVRLNSLVNAGLSGAVASLDDPYSHYYSPSSYSSFENITNPQDDGIGVEVLPNPRGLEIAEAFPNSPAARAGLGYGDVITAVGGTALAGRSEAFASKLIRGRPGSKVTLTVLARGRRRVMTLRRASVTVPVASSKLLHYGGKRIGYLLFTQFTQGSGDQLRAQVRKMLSEGAQGLILDLRGNGGGLLAQAINVASIFLPDGTVVSTRGRAVGDQVYMAQGNAIAPRIPLVVLVNRGTASSAEIVTGALKDRGRARVVGTNTFGKGVFQEVQTLSNGGALDITVGEYYTPNGQNLGAGGVREGRGITPNVYVTQPAHGGADRQLAAAQRVLAAEIR